MSRIIHILIWLGIGAWFVVAAGFISEKSGEVLCNRVEVHLDDTVHNRFITESDIRNLLDHSQARLHGYPLSEINTRELEQVIEQNQWVRNAEISTDVTGKLEINVEQRIPLVRIIPEGTRGYYLDTEGKAIPLSDHFIPHILLVTGHIPEGAHDAGPGDLGDLYAFCTYIAGNDFWNNQIVQVYVNRKGEFELIPRVGSHQILLGSLDQWQRKLHNLKLLYEQGLSRYGWNNYSTINLKYTNQVICTKR